MPSKANSPEAVSRGGFKRTLLTGIFIILPLFVTVWVIRFGFSQIDKAVTPTILRVIRLAGFGWILEEGWVNFIAPLISVTVLVLLIYFVGLVGGNVIGKQLLSWLDRLLRNIPLVKGIYSSTRQFIDTFSSKERAFNKVVLVEYPRRGLWTLALLTGDTQGEVQHKTSQDLLSVFVPTTPNPTSGWLLFVPREDVVILDMTVDDAFKMVISGGVLAPAYPPKDNTKPVTT